MYCLKGYRFLCFYFTFSSVIYNSQIVSSIIFTVAAAFLCFAGALFTGTEIAPLLSKMGYCQYFPVENSCKCFHHSELRQVSIIFRDTANCNGIQNKLRDLVYGMCGVYSGGLITCILAAVMETALLCRKRRSKVRFIQTKFDQIVVHMTASRSHQIELFQGTLLVVKFEGIFFSLSAL